MAMQDWTSGSMPLPAGHGWKARPGSRIFVADRGAVRFEFPEGWLVRPDSDSIKFYDKTPPDDDCVLAFSYLRLPPADWSSLSLSVLVEQACGSEKREQQV